MKKAEGKQGKSLTSGSGAVESSLILYQTEDLKTRIEVRLEGGTVWLTQRLMSVLYQVGVNTINHHIKSIFEDGEAAPEATIRNYRIVQTEGERDVTRVVEHYNLDIILAVGYRVRSHRGVQFRRWATERLGEFLVKGFTLDDERLKQSSSSVYFEELLQRIRDIRSSEKVFWRKVLEIYATSIDYDPSTEASQLFFATVQNKMHWAVHGQTAAEIISSRADATLPNMGLTSWTGASPKKADVGIAKNYLKEDELAILNRIVTAYLEFAELQALSRKPMFMRDWIAKLDDFLRISQKEILTHAGKVSHEIAIAKAEAAYEEYRKTLLSSASAVEKDFEVAVAKLERLPRGKSTKKGGGERK